MVMWGYELFVKCLVVWHTCPSNAWVMAVVVMKCILCLIFGSCFGCLTGYLLVLEEKGLLKFMWAT